MKKKKDKLSKYNFYNNSWNDSLTWPPIGQEEIQKWHVPECPEPEEVSEHKHPWALNQSRPIHSRKPQSTTTGFKV